MVEYQSKLTTGTLTAAASALYWAMPSNPKGLAIRFIGKEVTLRL